MTTLVAGIILVLSMAIVGWPLVKGIPSRKLDLVEDHEVSELLAQKDSTLLAISELEADYEMGNLSREDYQELRKKYEEKAVELLRSADHLRAERGLGVAATVDDDIEARVASLRGRKKTVNASTGMPCPSCRATVQPEDSFCSRCGAALALTCPACATAVGRDDLFCSKCGAPIAGEAA